MRTTEELNDILGLVLRSNAKTQKAVLGFEVENTQDIDIIIEYALDNIHEVEYSENMNDAYKNFLKYFKDICFDEENYI